VVDRPDYRSARCTSRLNEILSKRKERRRRRTHPLYDVPSDTTIHSPLPDSTVSHLPLLRSRQIGLGVSRQVEGGR
jgi:hypothetical protein